MQGKINLPGHCLLSMQTSGCMAEYFTTAGYFYKTSTSAIQDSPILSICFEVLHSVTGMSVHRDAEICLKRGWYHIHSHQHCPSSVLQRLCCPSIRQCASQYKWYSRTPGIVLILCFWSRPGLSQSLGFEPVTDVSPERAAHVLSACLELEKVA